MIELDELKAALKILPTGDASLDAEEDGFLLQCEEAAVGHVELVTGRPWGAVAERTEYFPADGRSELWLAAEPAASPAPIVKLDGQTLAADTYRVRGRRIDLGYAAMVHPSGWYGAPEYAVTYTAGYEAGHEPADIRQVVIWLVGHMHEHRVPVVTDAASAEMPHHLAAFLHARRRITV